MSESSPLVLTLSNLQSQIKSIGQELKGRVDELANAHDTIQSLHTQLDDQAQTNEVEVTQVKVEWKDVQDESANLNVKANDYFASREDRLNSVRNENLGRIELLEEQLDFLAESVRNIIVIIEDLTNSY